MNNSRNSSVSFWPKEKLMLVYTYKCNAKCSHCIVSSSIDREEKLDKKIAKVILEQARKSGKTLVSLTGGEVFLFYDELEEIIKHAHTLDYYVTVNTNGFWAKNYEVAFDMLQELKRLGLSEICPSADAFHSPFVPTEYIGNIREACKDLNITCDINFYPTGSEEDNKVIELLKLEDVIYYTEGLNLRGREASKYEDAYQKKTIIELGREYFKYFGGDKDIVDKYCSAILTINPQGQAIVSCDVSSDNSEFLNTPLYLGNIFDEDLETILKKEKENKFVQALYNKPYNYFNELLLKDSVTGQEYASIANKKYIHLTEYFLEILNNDVYKNRLVELIKI